MEHNFVELQGKLNSLIQRLSELSEELSLAQSCLDESSVPPSFALAENIVSERQRFEELRAQVVQMAQSLKVTTPSIEEISSVQGIDVVLTTVAEVQQIISEENQKALEILDKILQIYCTESNIFALLEPYLTQARKLHNSILMKEHCLDPELKKIASGEHPFVQLLTLISERESPDYQRLASLQAEVSQAFGMPVAIAGLTGKLLFLSDLKSVLTEKAEVVEMTVEQSNDVVLEFQRTKPASSNIELFSGELELSDLETVEENDDTFPQELESPIFQWLCCMNRKPVRLVLMPFSY